MVGFLKKARNENGDNCESKNSIRRMPKNLFQRKKKSHEEGDNEEGNNDEAPEKASLLDRIGGEAVLHMTIAEFYKRSIADEELKPFFQNADYKRLIAHQKQIFIFAFTELPQDEYLKRLIRKSHQRLFPMGLSEKHFDRFIFHVKATLNKRGFDDQIIGEVVSVLNPMRSIFAEASRDWRRVLIRGDSGSRVLHYEKSFQENVEEERVTG